MHKLVIPQLIGQSLARLSPKLLRHEQLNLANYEKWIIKYLK